MVQFLLKEKCELFIVLYKRTNQSENSYFFFGGMSSGEKKNKPSGKE